MTAAAAADDLVLAEHRIVDGARPLEVPRPSRSVFAAYVDPQVGRDLECWTVRWAEMHSRPIPARCRLRITRGDHYLLWVEHDTRDEPTGNEFAWCAPCAVSEWGPTHGVREATP